MGCHCQQYRGPGDSDGLWLFASGVSSGGGSGVQEPGCALDVESCRIRDGVGNRAMGWSLGKGVRLIKGMFDRRSARSTECGASKSERKCKGRSIYTEVLTAHIELFEIESTITITPASSDSCAD